MNATVYLVVVASLGVISIIVAIGGVYLACTERPIPPFLSGLAGTTLGALVGLLSQPPKTTSVKNGDTKQ